MLRREDLNEKEINWVLRKLRERGLRFDRDFVDSSLQPEEALRDLAGPYYRSNQGPIYRKLVVVKDLIPKILQREKIVTIRARPLRSAFYEIYCNLYRPCSQCPHLSVRIIEAMKIDLDEINDKLARLTGCKNRDDLISRLQYWYGSEQQEFYVHYLEPISQ